jgi:hypothetical protein
MGGYFPVPNRASVLGRTNTGFASAYPQPKQSPWGDYGTRVLGMVKELAAPQADVDAMAAMEAETVKLLDEGNYKQAIEQGFTPENFALMAPYMMGAGVIKPVTAYKGMMAKDWRTGSIFDKADAPGLLPTDEASRMAERRPLEDYGRKLVQTGGRKFNVQNSSGDIDAEVWMKEGMGGVADIRVDKYKRGKGLANATLDEIEKTTGVPIKVTDNLSEEGFKMWQRRDPDQVAGSLYHFKDDLTGKVASDGRTAGPIVEVRNEYVSIRPSKGITVPVRKDQLIEQGLIK